MTGGTSVWAAAARVLVAPYLVALGLIVWLPAGDAAQVTGAVGWAADTVALWGVPRAAAAVVFEFVANIALFVPFGVLVVAAWPRLGAWRVVLLGAALSVVIELVQLGLPSRVSTVSDVIANSAGAMLGAVMWVTLARVLGGRGHSRVEATSRGALVRSSDAS